MLVFALRAESDCKITAEKVDLGLSGLLLLVYKMFLLRQSRYSSIAQRVRGKLPYPEPQKLLLKENS